MAVELLGGAEKNPSADGHTVPYACTRWPTKSRVFAPVFDELACSYKNEGSIPFTRSTLFLSKSAVFPGTVIRVSYEAPRMSPVFRGIHSRNRNRGSGLGVVFSQRALHGISGETRRGYDVTRHMAEKQFHACLNLLWCESFRLSHVSVSFWSPKKAPRLPAKKTGGGEYLWLSPPPVRRKVLAGFLGVK